jgi:hypothetical protein
MHCLGLHIIKTYDPACVVDCLALYLNGARGDGVYNITIPGDDHQSPVYCDMTRGPSYNGDVDFNRNYNDYIKGFGNGWVWTLSML